MVANMNKVFGVASTTRPDLLGDEISVEALRAMAERANGSSAILINLEHDRTIPPLGKVLSAKIEQADDGHFELCHDMEIFEVEQETFSIDGVKCFEQSSKVDFRPFIDENDNEIPAILEIGYEPTNFEKSENIKSYFKSIGNDYPYIQVELLHKSEDLLATLFITFSKTACAYLVSKDLLKMVADKVLEPVIEDFSKLYPFIKKVVTNFCIQVTSRKLGIIVIKVPGIPHVEFVAETHDPHLLIEALTTEKFQACIRKSEELAKTIGASMVQFIFNDVGEWEFNYLFTNTGKVIGTFKSYERKKRYDLSIDRTQLSIGGTIV